MNAPEPSLAPDEETLETARPSVSITRNAKGQAQFTVKVYGIDSSEQAALNAAAVAQGIYDQLTAKYGGVTS